MANIPRKRQLRRTTRSKPRFSRTQRVPKLYTFRRGLTQAFTWSPASGFGAVGSDMTIVPTLGSCVFMISGVTINTTPLPGSSEFQALFDQYRIKKVNYQIYWSQNLDNTGVSAPIPVLHLVNDYDSTGAFSKDQILQHSDCKTYQVKEGSPIRWSVYPKVRVDALLTTELFSSSAWVVSKPWLDTSSPTIQHLGTRVYVDNLSRASAGDLGTFLFKVEYELDFKNVK